MVCFPSLSPASLSSSGFQPVVGPPVVHGQLPGGPRAKAISVFFKDIDTHRTIFQHFMSQFSVVVHDQET